VRRYADVVRRSEAAGLGVRGACHLDAADSEPGLAHLGAAKTLVLLGFTGSAQWAAFAESPEARDGEPDPLDRWSRRQLDVLAAEFGATACYPSGTPQLPLQRLALRCEPVHQSPLGLLIHPRWGLWHAYRGALAFTEQLELPPLAPLPRPCDTCDARPCLSACPVGAFRHGHFDVDACVRHVASEAGHDCRNQGCRARRACPVGSGHTYVAAQQSFHMQAFLRACSASVRG